MGEGPAEGNGKCTGPKLPHLGQKPSWRKAHTPKNRSQKLQRQTFPSPFLEQGRRGLERGQEPQSTPTRSVTQTPASPGITIAQLSSERPDAHLPGWLGWRGDQNCGHEAPGSTSGPVSTQRAGGLPPCGTSRGAPLHSPTFPGRSIPLLPQSGKH